MTRLFVLLIALSTAACASTGATPQPFPTPGRAAPPVAAGADRGDLDAYALTGTALALRGVPYRNGGADLSGFDCSGFVWYVYAQHGFALPRTVPEQFRAGHPAAGPLRAGDLVFFSTVAAGPSHVGIALGADAFVHAPSSTGVVRVERLSSPYWSSRYLGARRAFDSRE
jgi:cell wall-associated NlpC family hydrolase